MQTFHWTISFEKVKAWIQERWTLLLVLFFLPTIAKRVFIWFDAVNKSEPYPPSQKYEDPILYGKFPSDFKWGAATAAYQVRP